MICAEGGEWKRRVLSNGCQFHQDPSECEFPLQAHHILTQQQLKKHGLAEFILDTDVGMGLCYEAHRKHHSAVRRIPYELVPDAAIRFAFEHGLDYLLDRYYPRNTEFDPVPQRLPGGQLDGDPGFERISVVAYYRTKLVDCGSADDEADRARIYAENRNAALLGE